jgi:hypothetical protein
VTEGREVTVRIHPISVDGRAMREEAATPRVRSLRHRSTGGATTTA